MLATDGGRKANDVRAIQIEQFGGPEVLQLAELPDPEPQEGQALIEVSRVGVNYADTHQAENSYLAPATLPLIPGAEVAGTTRDGRRVVAFVDGGAYAEKAAAWEPLVFDVPDGVHDGQALALLLQGLTAWHILRTSARVQPGETVVVHAAAGGVGSLAVQLAKVFGSGRVIATASSQDKREFALSLGADVAVDSTDPELESALRGANEGRKVDVVLEMAGGTVFDQSLACLAPFGRLVTYGMAGRELPQPLYAPQLMGGSQGVIGFWLVHCMTRPEMLRGPMEELFSLTLEGRLRPIVGATYPLADARLAHESLRSRGSVGKLLLDPTV